MSELKFTCDCFMCRRSFQMGPHRYEGRRVPAWDIMICDTCQSANWDGVVLGTYPHLIRYLKALGIAIELNKKGWLEIPR